MPTATERIQELTQATTPDAPKVALDTCCVQYYIGTPRVQPWADCLGPIFQAGIDGKIELYVSTVVISELLAQVHFEERHNAGYDPELDFLAIMNRHFQILDVTGDVAKAAGRLRASHIPGDKMTLKTPDALIGATSLTNGHTLFVTNDAQLAHALPDPSCIYLRDVVLEWLPQNFPNPCFGSGEPVAHSSRGKGLPNGFSAASLDIGPIQPDPSAKWRRILKDAQIVAATVDEPCVFFVLAEKNGRRIETREVLFWRDSLTESRPPSKLIKRLHDHLDYSARTRTAANAKASIHGIVFASLAHEKACLNDSGLASKSDHQKNTAAWNAYLALWRTYRSCLDLPQTTWLLCEDGAARVMDIAATVRFLDQARNVLGWKDER